MRLASITCYPVKSLGGYSPDEAAMEARGLAGDRRWMVVDERLRFVTRREVPAMATLSARQVAGGLEIAGPAGACRAAVPGDGAPAATATVWRDRVAVRLGSDEADAFLSDALGRRVRLAFQPDASVRPVGGGLPGEQVSLADGFPLLVTTQASLDALNARLERPVTMERFRPNLVFSGAQPWAEHGWARARVGSAELRFAGASTRCVVVTQQPLTGERLDGDEPLATLRAMGRRTRDGIVFGENAVPLGPGTVRVGDAVVPAISST